MCLQCHEGVTNAEVLNELHEIQKEPKFEQWNSTSVGHMLIACAGANDIEVRDLALLTMDEFLHWYASNRTDSYLPTCGMQAMPSINELKNQVNWMRSTEYKTQCLQRVIDNFPDIPDDIVIKWNSFHESPKDNSLFIFILRVVVYSALFLMGWYFGKMMFV